jgi:hypothetical protein
VPAAELGGERKVSPQRRADGDAINGYVRSLGQKRIDVNPDYVASKGLNVDVVYPRVVELVQNHNLQENVGATTHQEQSFDATLQGSHRPDS